MVSDAGSRGSRPTRGGGGMGIRYEMENRLRSSPRRSEVGQEAAMAEGELERQ